MPLYDDITYIGPPNHFRNKATKYGITVHATANTASARDEATYAKRRTDGTSSHYYVDNAGIIQSLNTDYGANHAGAQWPNDHCIAYEFVGTNAWSTSKWIDSIDFNAAAKQMAQDCKRWNIPARHLTISQLRSHERGISTHNDCRLAFGGTDHTDPGNNFPLTYLIDKVKSHLEGNDMESNEQLTMSDYFKNYYQNDESLKDGKMSAGSALVGSYAHARQGRDYIRDHRVEVRAEFAALRGELTGLNTLIQTLATASAARDQQILDLIVSTENGETDANEVVRRIGELLRNNTTT